MRIIEDQAKNGLRIITSPFPSLESVTVTLWVGIGSRDETEKISGISHFLEHMVFKGGNIYKNAKQVSEAIDSMGGEGNAATSKEWTYFYIRSSSRHLEKVFEILSDITLNTALKEQDIEREKGVIIEEINMYEDTPMYKIGDLFENLIFGENSDLGRDIIGTKKTVSSLTRQDFVTFREKNYHAGNMLVTVSGGVDSENVKSLANKYFGSVDKDKTTKPAGDSVKFNSKDRLLIRKKQVDQVHLELGFPGISFDDEDRFVESVVTVILGRGMSSRLFTEVREKRGLAYSVSASFMNYVDTGYVGAHAGLDPKRVYEALEVVIGEFYALREDSKKVTAKELQKAKEYIRGHISLSLESTKSVNSLIGKEILATGKVRTIKEIFDAVESVTTEDIYRFAKKYFVNDKLYLAMIGPFDETKRIEKIMQG